MKNTILTLGVMLTLAAFAGMMRVKTDVQTMDTERRKLVFERAKLRETKRVYEAEWALLVSPERLQKMVAGLDYVPGSSLNMQNLVAPTPTVVVKPEVSTTVVSATEASATVSWPQ